MAKAKSCCATARSWTSELCLLAAGGCPEVLVAVVVVVVGDVVVVVVVPWPLGTVTGVVVAGLPEQ